MWSRLNKHQKNVLINVGLLFYRYTVDWEIFAFKYFRVIDVRVSNFHHKVQEVKIKHGEYFQRLPQLLL